MRLVREMLMAPSSDVRGGNLCELGGGAKRAWNALKQPPPVLSRRKSSYLIVLEATTLLVISGEATP
jgi:hypothetical protein